MRVGDALPLLCVFNQLVAGSDMENVSRFWTTMRVMPRVMQVPYRRTAREGQSSHYQSNVQMQISTPEMEMGMCD